jgi:peptide/nickel transport system ATP-binding protein/oligopeptide transport system ATP-binding protein
MNCKEDKITCLIEDLRVDFFTYNGTVKAVDGVSFKVESGKILGLIGETGCGKSVTALSIMRLIDEPGKIMSGRIIFEGEDLLKKTEAQMRKLRGCKISIIFQNPMVSLNPVFKIGSQVIETLQKHKNIRKKEALEETLDLLESVKMPDPSGMIDKYPHELSGGMLQRVLIAIAISCGPALIIADEATSSLDVTIQAQILRLIRDLNGKLGASTLMITHDFGVLATSCDSSAVMYAGNIVENGDTSDIIKSPLHPYTKGLINAIPKLSQSIKKLNTIKGTIPSLVDPPPGCIFHLRCDFAKGRCLQEKPELLQVENRRWVSCFLYK